MDRIDQRIWLMLAKNKRDSTKGFTIVGSFESPEEILEFLDERELLVWSSRTGRKVLAQDFKIIRFKDDMYHNSLRATEDGVHGGSALPPFFFSMHTSQWEFVHDS